MCCLCFLCLRDSRRAAPSGGRGCGGWGLGQASGSPVAKQATQPEEREGVQPANRLQASILLHLFALPHVPPGNSQQSRPAPHQSTETKPDMVQAPAASEHASNIVFFGEMSQARWGLLKGIFIRTVASWEVYTVLIGPDCIFWYITVQSKSSLTATSFTKLHLHEFNECTW